MTSDMAVYVAGPAGRSKRLIAVPRQGRKFYEFPEPWMLKSCYRSQNATVRDTVLGNHFVGRGWMRYILICFLFMGWAFYELSGGADFDKDAVRETRMAALELKEPKPAPKPRAEPIVVTEAPIVVVDTDPPAQSEPTRVSLNLTTLAPSAAAPQANDISEAVEAAVSDAVEQASDLVPRNVGTTTSSADTPAIIPSLIDPNDGVTPQPAEPVETVSFDDIRTVSASNVNVRGGPGTDYGVVGRLGRGDQIKVLQDDGFGWVRFETTDGSTAGWMADFLLSGG